MCYEKIAYFFSKSYFRKYFFSPYNGFFFTFLQQSPRLLSPGSGNVSSRYAGWNAGMANGGTAHLGAGNSKYSNKFEDSDSGTGSSNEAHVIRHIDRNILSCQICQQRYKEPKVSKST